mmetsp:Transcript_21535/g.55255  ORF Transcript_21535/g.55255 Transcript_21535/m.55255 type:complete len:124 (+) Transcript_21535:84-455(+)|eukprot:jgi/Tetstr1/424120/TSEL_014729.t1
MLGSAALLQASATGMASYGAAIVGAPGPFQNICYKKNSADKHSKRAWRMMGYCMLAGATRDAFASKQPNKYNLMAAGASWGMFPVMIASQSFEDDGIKPWIAATNTALCLTIGGILLKKAMDA